MMRTKSETVTPLDIEDVANEYNIANDLKCTREAKVAVQPAAPEVVPEIPQVEIDEIDILAKSDEPPGAATLRLVLQLLICLVVVDGTRRSLHLRRQKLSPSAPSTSQPTRDCTGGSIMAQPSQTDAAASESAWLDMVTAARNGDESSFNQALGHASLLKCVDAWGCTALHFAVAGGSLAIVKGLIERGAEIDALDVGDETPLHFAARGGHASMCELLLNAGARIDAVSKDGLTPLAVAGFANQEQTCRALVRCGAGVAGMSDAELPTLIVSHVFQQMFAA